MDTSTPTIKQYLQSRSLGSLQSEVVRLSGERDEIDAMIGMLKQAIAWKRSEGQPYATPVAFESDGSLSAQIKLKGRAAIRAIVRDNPRDRVWTIPEMLEAIKARGWDGNTHSVQVNLSRMARDGEFLKPADGQYLPASLRGAPAPTAPNLLEGGVENS